MGFSRKMQYDRSLRLSNANFGNDLQRKVPGFISKLSTLLKNELQSKAPDLFSKVFSKAKPESPLEKEILVTLAHYTSSDTITHLGDTVALPQDGENVVLPKDWSLLTTAFNNDPSNGYRGFAFVNYLTHQVVIAHRGTYLHAGSIKNCIDGVISTEYAPQVCSAVTFVEIIRQEICKLRIQSCNYNLTITGHSFGGWLAQVTGFTVEFTSQSDTGLEFTHAEPGNGLVVAVKVFDSPGCYDMIKKLCTDYCFGAGTIVYFGKRVLNYTLGPNVINHFGYQIGKQIQIIADFCKDKSSHGIKMIEKAILDINSIIRETPYSVALMSTCAIGKIALQVSCTLLNLFIGIVKLFTQAFLSVVERGLTFFADLGRYMLSVISGNPTSGQNLAIERR